MQDRIETVASWAPRSCVRAYGTRATAAAAAREAHAEAEHVSGGVCANGRRPQPRVTQRDAPFFPANRRVDFHRSPSLEENRLGQGRALSDGPQALRGAKRGKCDTWASQAPTPAGANDARGPFAGLLTWRFSGVTRVHARSLATQFPLQNRPNEGMRMGHEMSRVSFLMRPFCVRAMMPSEATPPQKGAPHWSSAR